MGKKRSLKKQKSMRERDQVKIYRHRDTLKNLTEAMTVVCFIKKITQIKRGYLRHSNLKHFQRSSVQVSEHNRTSLMEVCVSKPDFRDEMLCKNITSLSSRFFLHMCN